MKRVCIIGAGISGLLTLRHLNDQVDADLFEYQMDVGGQWIYNPLTDTTTPSDNIFLQKAGHIPQSTYKGLIANLPHYTMTFMDYPYPFQTPTFVTMEEFLRYIQSYVEFHGIKKYIHFGHFVERVHILPSREYQVTVFNTAKKERFTKVYDYVVVANGHNSKSFTPKLEGHFSGQQVHIHNIREFKPEQYYGKRVAIIGFHASARDILLQLLLHKKNLKAIAVSGMTDRMKKWGFGKILTDKLGVQNRGRLVKFGNEKELIFEDGTKGEFDVIIWTTGYVYDFSFLEQGILQNYSDSYRLKSFGPLYLQSIHVKYPSLLFVGLMQGVPLLTYFIEWNAILVASVILGTHKTKLSDIPKLYADQLKEMKEINPSLKLIYRVGVHNKNFVQFLQQFKQFIGLPEDWGQEQEGIMMDGLVRLILKDSFFLWNQEKRKIKFTPPSYKGKKIADFAPKSPELLRRPKL